MEKTGTTNTWSSSCCCKDTSCDVSGQIWQEVHNCATQQLVLENMRGVIDNNNNTNRNNHNNTGYVKFWHISITKSVFPRKGAFRLDIEMHYQQRQFRQSYGRTDGRTDKRSDYSFAGLFSTHVQTTKTKQKCIALIFGCQERW